MKKVRVTGVKILTPSMRFLTTFLNFSKLISSLKAQVCNILKVPKREIFVTELIILSHPIWIGDLRTKAKN